MKGIITTDLSKSTDPVWVEETKKFLKENVTDVERQGAKFG